MNTPAVPAVPEPEHMRASDADRERVAETLREAAAEGRLTLEELDERLDATYAAKTYAELTPVTRDLPGTQGILGSGLPTPGSPSSPLGGPRGGMGGAEPPIRGYDFGRYGGQPSSSTAVAVLGGFTRKGDWVVPKNFTAFALLGGGEIDMRDARFEEQSVTLHVVAVLGGMEITVPDDATVHVNGVGIMGGFDHQPTGSGTPGGPVITINGVAMLGGVEVKRRPSRTDRSARSDRQDRLAARLERRAARLERRTRGLE